MCAASVLPSPRGAKADSIQVGGEERRDGACRRGREREKGLATEFLTKRNPCIGYIQMRMLPETE